MNLRTVSLRQRVTLSAIGVLGVVLLGVVLLVDGLFAAQSKRDVETALLEKARVAEQLVEQHVLGATLVNRLEGRGVEVRLVMPDGTVFGKTPEEGVTHEVDRDLADGSAITLYTESTAITAAQLRLRRLLLLVGFGALAVTAVALVWTVRRALAPLDAMTTLARSIARGKRGYRLNPSSADNELGRTAAAFDDMLDSLEGSEERTKRFVADAAHELRTPIAGVQAVAEALMQTTDAEERERLNLLLVRESRRAGRLVDDLLALARIDVGLELHRERVDLLTLAEAEVGRTRLLAPDFDIEVEGMSAFVSGDPQRLAQVLANLADNARQATGPSGRVRLRVSTVGGFALLVVSDNGPGVAPEDRERIFDRLVRLDEARDRRSGGSGLGLAIARGVVRAHGGELTCTDAGRVDAVLLDIDEPTLRMKGVLSAAGGRAAAGTGAPSGSTRWQRGESLRGQQGGSARGLGRWEKVTRLKSWRGLGRLRRGLERRAKQGARPGPEPALALRSGAGPGTGPEPGSGAGPGPGSRSGSGSRLLADLELRLRAGEEPALRPGTRAELELGPGLESGQGPRPGVGGEVEPGQELGHRGSGGPLFGRGMPGNGLLGGAVSRAEGPGCEESGDGELGRMALGGGESGGGESGGGESGGGVPGGGVPGPGSRVPGGGVPDPGSGVPGPGGGVPDGGVTSRGAAFVVRLPLAG